MKLFEDIIDSVDGGNDDVRTSKLVSSSDDGPMYTTLTGSAFKDLENRMWDRFSRRFDVVSTYRSATLERNVGILDYILDSSPVIDDYSMQNIWTTGQENTIMQHNVWLDLVDYPNYSEFLMLLTRISNLFWDIQTNMNVFEICDYDAQNRVRIFMNNIGTSFWKQMETAKKAVETYRKTKDEFDLDICKTFMEDVISVVRGQYVPSDRDILMDDICDFNTEWIRHDS